MVSVEFETNVGDIDGLAALWAETRGNPTVCIAVLDGPVDEAHPCFLGANLTRLPTLVADGAGTGRMSAHGTHVTSEIFGQPGGPVQGVAPGCRGLLAAIFPDRPPHRLAQLDLARAIEQAVENGAHVINISAGEPSATGDADELLERAIRLCEKVGVLITAAAGNDGCNCLHVPAAVRSVLAVGAISSRTGHPLGISNWGRAYQSKGVLAPGENIRGAVPGGGTTLRTGTSFAAPIVAGVAALLLSIQHRQGKKPDASAVREAILASALPCSPPSGAEQSRCLAGVLNIPGAYAIINAKTRGAPKMTTPDLDGDRPALELAAITLQPSEPTVSQKLVEAGQKLASLGQRFAEEASPRSEAPIQPLATGQFAGLSTAEPAPSSVESASNCDCHGGRGSYVFVIGTVGYDFGTEARRDSFRQLMPANNNRPANPYATEQMVRYLGAHSAEASKVIWTLNLELTPIYALEPEMPFAPEIFEFLRSALNGQIQKEDSPDYISRVSCSGVLSSRTTRLYSGQVVPIVVIQSRGLWSWNVKSLIDAVVSRFDQKMHEHIRISLQNYLSRVYYELRNLGQTAPDRALNFSATNAFQASEAMSRALHPKELVPSAGLYTLADISVARSPFCRMDSDCWDVKLTFFDPENERRARTAMRFTVDVSDELPVTLGPVRYWTEATAR